MFLIYPIVFLIPLMLGTFLVISSSSWFSLWLGMELNVVSFIPLILTSSSSSAESAISYFLIQAFSSLLFISVILVSFMYSYMNMSSMFMMLVMMLKMGGAPFYSWIIFMSKSLSWPMMAILLIWQKINPLVVMNMFNSSLMIFIMMNSMAGSITGMIQLSLRKMMVLSSLVHLSWIFLGMQYSSIHWVLYFLGYSMNLVIVLFIFMSYNLNYLKDIFKMKINNYESTLISFYIFNMAGLPPFTGFFLKWMILSLTIYENLFVSLFILFMSLLSLSFYIRMIYSSMMLSKVNMIFSFNVKTLFQMFPIMINGPLLISLI